MLRKNGADPEVLEGLQKHVLPPSEENKGSKPPTYTALFWKADKAEKAHQKAVERLLSLRSQATDLWNEITEQQQKVLEAARKNQEAHAAFKAQQHAKEVQTGQATHIDDLIEDKEDAICAGARCL